MSEMTLLYKEQKTEYYTKVFENFCNISDKHGGDPFIFDSKVNGEIIPNMGYFSRKELFHDESNFVENYANPYATPLMTRKTIVIEENENKIALKVYTYTTIRSLLKKFFRVRKNITFLTFNKKRKQFFYGEINSKKKRKINQMMRVNITDLSSTPLISKLTMARIGFETGLESSENNGTFVLNKFLDLIIDQVDVSINKDQNARKKYYEMILKFRNIKYPNAFEKFANISQTVKEIRQCDSNIVTYYMKKTGLKGKKARVLLNDYENIDIDSMFNLQKWIGLDNFNKIKDEAFLSKKMYSSWNLVPYFGDNNYFESVSKSEMENIISIINTTTTEESLGVIVDHLRFQQELKKYDEHYKIQSKTFEDFVFEHSEVSALLQSYKTGYVERFYGKDEDLVQDPIYSNEYTYFPKLLKNTNEYEDESSHQHNCVRTYIEKAYCFIISLRRGSPNGSERATLEYHFSTDGVKRAQSRTKYNKSLSDEWNEPLEELDKYVNYLYKNGLLELPVMTKKFKNGKIIKSVASFDKKERTKGSVITMYPVWDNEIKETEGYGFWDQPDVIYDIDDLP